MTNYRPYNGQIPTDPITVLLLLLACIGLATALPADQMESTLGLAQIVLGVLALQRK